MFGRAWIAASLAVCAACGGDSTSQPDARPAPLFEEKPECQGAAITPYAGEAKVVISALAIGAVEDGFDLDGDGDPDNKMGSIAGLAADSIAGSFLDYSVIIPMEFFDLAPTGGDSCVKYAVYVGNYAIDGDGDGSERARGDGDCNDLVAAINRGAAEVDGNGIDDDCDGLADEAVDGMPSTSTADADGDGVTIAAGDCDDTSSAIDGTVEICGDGLDNDCDGTADRTGPGDAASTACNPYDLVAPEALTLDPLSFTDTGAPVIAFTSAEITEAGGVRTLTAGPGKFSVAIPIDDDITLDLRITGATMTGTVVTDANGFYLTGGKLGGIIDARTADTIRGLDVPDFGITPDRTLLDAIFANLLRTFLALPSSAQAAALGYESCSTPDIDVDHDGLEAFCDSNIDDELKAVDVCIDGDGTVVLDTATTPCTEAVVNGVPRFVDGISVALTLDTVPAGSLNPP